MSNRRLLLTCLFLSATFAAVPMAEAEEPGLLVSTAQAPSEPTVLVPQPQEARPTDIPAPMNQPPSAVPPVASPASTLPPGAPTSFPPPRVRTEGTAAATFQPMPTPSANIHPYTVQVGAYSDRAGAEKLRSELAAKGEQVQELQLHGSVWRVRIGHFTSRDEAVRHSETLNRTYGYKSIPMKNEN